MSQENKHPSQKVRTEVGQLKIKLSDLINAKQIATERTEPIDDFRQSLTEQTLKERETEREGREKYYGLRDKWSWFIFGFVSFMLLFQLFLTIMIGTNGLTYKDNKIFLHLVIGENFAQIIGMGFIVAKFLFPQKP